MKVIPYFKAKDFLLYNADSIDFMLNHLPENSIDMIFADPPYHLSNGGFTCHSGKMVDVNKGKWDESKGFEKDFEFDREWIAACKKVLKPNGTIWISGTYHNIYACGYALQLEGYKILNDITWYKPNAAPNLSGRYFTASHETLIWARKEEKGKHTFNYKAMKNGDWHNHDLIKNDGKQMRSVWALNENDSVVWAINTPTSKEKVHGKHPTQKPLKLLERIILASTNPEDLILDPFSGSSTTGIASALHNRKFIGVDNNKDFLELSKKRFLDVKN